MGITGLIPFLEKASRRVNVDEFRGCTVAIDSYCWLHKGAFACAERIVRGEDTDIHIKYCLKYVTMLLSRNIKPILVFDGRHLPAKAMTEAKRRESRNISKKRAAELISLGQTEEARSYMRRSIDITHEMALALIKECRQRNVDCIVAPYEADAQLAYLNIHNYAHLVITEDSDLILFGCNKVLFKMDLDGMGTLVESAKLPLVMRCPLERYSFARFRQMCIMSGCDYLASLPGIGLAKARQFVTATQDTNFANALKKLASFFKKSSFVVTDEYRENFLKAEATFKHQYVYDPIERRMLRLNEPEDEDTEKALCVNAGELLDAKTALQLAVGNVDPFSLKALDCWHPDTRNILDSKNTKSKSSSWHEKPAPHPSIWHSDYRRYLKEERPWLKKVEKPEPIIAVPQTRIRKKVVNLVNKFVPETQELTVETLSSMYCIEPTSKRIKTDSSQDLHNSKLHLDNHNVALTEEEIMNELSQDVKGKSPILKNKQRSFSKRLNKSNEQLKSLSRFPRTIIDDKNVIESKFFNSESSREESRDQPSSGPDTNKGNQSSEESDRKSIFDIDSQCIEIPDTEEMCKENVGSPDKARNNRSPILEPSPRSRNPFRVKPLRDLLPSDVIPSHVIPSDVTLSEDSVIENTYPLEGLVTPVDSQSSFGEELEVKPEWRSAQSICEPTNVPVNSKPFKRPSCRVPGLRRPLPTNQPTLLSKFGFQKRPAMKK